MMVGEGCVVLIHSSLSLNDTRDASSVAFGSSFARPTPAYPLCPVLFRAHHPVGISAPIHSLYSPSRHGGMASRRGRPPRFDSYGGQFFHSRLSVDPLPFLLFLSSLR